MGKYYRIPNCLKPLILKEMEKLNLIRKVNGRMIEFLSSEFNIEGIGKYYMELEIY